MTEMPERELYPPNPRILDEKLIAFNKARLAEDQAAAEVAANVAGPDWIWKTVVTDEDEVTDQVTNPDGTVLVDTLGGIESEAPHIARHDPARAFREIEAKHRRLETYRRAAWATQTAPADESHSLRSYRDAAWGAVLADASVWAGHEDYDPKWKLDS